MPPTLQPIKRFPCTYKVCAASYDTEKEMKLHKKRSEEHDYCMRCDEDFESYDEYAQHKAFRPDNHNMACRVCGDEFKSQSGLKRHTELAHKVDQKLTCVGCGDQFFRASHLIEHLEFGHCPKISAVEFQGHIVHKYLIAELLKGGDNYDRFMQKISRYDAAVDTEEEGGVNLIDDQDYEAQEVDYKAIKPEIPELAKDLHRNHVPYPPLPSQTAPYEADIELASQFKGVSLGGDSDTGTGSTTLVESPTSPASSSTPRATKIWGTSNTARTLFPHAKATPAPSEWSIQQHDRDMEEQHGINIFNTRFWDPMTDDWNPDRFYDSVIQKYYCPFVCEQNYDLPADLNRHIINDHRITKMRCPGCNKEFGSCTALVAHCEARGQKCKINHADDFPTFLDRLSGGFLGVEDRVRPEYLHNPAVLLTNPLTGKVERFRPPTATYLQYTVTKPVSWKDKEKRPVSQIGGGGQQKATAWLQ